MQQQLPKSHISHHGLLDEDDDDDLMQLGGGRNRQDGEDDDDEFDLGNYKATTTIQLPQQRKE